MSINLTLLGQMITFAIFVWFTMKYVWPPVMQAMSDRQKKISEGLAAAERGQKDLQLAQKNVMAQLKEARIQANEMIEKANHLASQILEEARNEAKHEGKRLLEIAKTDIQREVTQVKLALQNEISNLVISCTERLMGSELDEVKNRRLVSDWIRELKE